MGQVIYPGLKEYVKSQILRGTESKDMYRVAVEDYGYASNIRSFYKYICKIKKLEISDEDLEVIGEDRDSIDARFINILERRKSVSGDDLCEELSLSPNEIFDLIEEFRKQGYEIICDEKNVILSTDVTSEGKELREPLGETEIIFGIASDLHIGSKECQLTALNEFCEICRKKGVKHIFVPGDVLAGHNVFPGQQFELYALSAEEQEESAIVNIPTGFDWYLLGGNHDYSFIKRGGGHNPLLVLDNAREDLHYVGFDEVDIPILRGVDAKLWHPSGGVPYSISYRVQKAIEQLAYRELAKVVWNQKDKPTVRFLFSGHLHIQFQAMFGSIFGAQCGTFEAQGSYLKRKGLHPLIGGYIIQANIRKRDGIIMNFDAKYYMFPDVIEDDWKNYKHYLPKKTIEPLFE